MVVDVGASTTRVRVLDLASKEVQLERSAAIGSAQDLVSFMHDIVETIGDIATFVAGFAAPLDHSRASVQMTNWSSDSLIEAESIVRLGIKRVLFLNDIEAAMYALTDIKDIGTEVIALSGDNHIPQEGNKVLVLPGTGLGSAGLVDLGNSSLRRWTIVQSQAQHFYASSEHDESNRLIGELARLLGRRPSWEDCVSGRGLERLYAVAGGVQHTPAEMIADRALSGESIASTALDCYYTIAGSFAQQLALSFLSYGGVFIAGSNTAKNTPFLKGSQFVEQFRKNPVMAQTLSRIPLFQITNELNLRGATAAVTSHFGDSLES